MTTRNKKISLFAGAILAFLPATFAGAQTGVPQTPATQTPPAITKPDTTKPATPAPVDWTALQAAYKYDATVTPKITSVDKSDDTAHIEHLTFTDAKGKTVTGLFLRPKADGVYPTALVLHGLGSDKDAFATIFAKPLVAKGIACLLLDAPLHGERKDPSVTPSAQNPIPLLAAMHDGVADYREAIGYLIKERKDVDATHIGLFGYSMGSIMGSILTGVDDRITMASLCVGGDLVKPMIPSVPDMMRPFAESVSPSNYIGHIAPRPVYMINALDDQTIPPPAAKLLQAAAQEPKTLVWVKGGHILPADDARKAVDWLVEHLTAPKAVTASTPSAP